VSSPCQFASDHARAVSRAPPPMMNNQKNAHYQYPILNVLD